MNNSASRRVERVGVLTKPHQPETLETVCRLIAWLAERDATLVATDGVDRVQVEARTGYAPEIATAEELAASVDLLVVLGGDGTMIAAARTLGDREIPVLGVNYGRLGYLAEFRTEEMLRALDSVFAGDFKIDSRVMLDAELVRADADEADGSKRESILGARVLNDAVIAKSSLRIVEIEARWNKQFVASFRADGLIVSTPTGSTAYNLSAGGPVVYPSMDAIVITPICPHTLSHRPLVVPDDGEIEIRIKNPHDEVALTLDGQIGFQLAAGDCVLIRKSRTRFHIVQPTNHNYFEVLRHKLRWGGGE